MVTQTFWLVYGSANMVGIGTDTPGATLDVRGSAVFNEDSANVGFLSS